MKKSLSPTLQRGLSVSQQQQQTLEKRVSTTSWVGLWVSCAVFTSSPCSTLGTFGLQPALGLPWPHLPPLKPTGALTISLCTDAEEWRLRQPGSGALHVVRGCHQTEPRQGQQDKSDKRSASPPEVGPEEATP